MLAYFYEIKMSFYKSASKTQSHIQSTAQYIFLRTPNLSEVFLPDKYGWVDGGEHSDVHDRDQIGHNMRINIQVICRPQIRQCKL